MKENTIRVLLVEDDKVDQMAFERMIKQHALPYQYLIVDSVEGFQKMLNTETFDVVIMDSLLGNGSRFDQINALSDIPIIIVTGNGNADIAVKAKQVGAFTYLLKDLAGTYLKTLPLIIAQAVQQKRAMRSDLYDGFHDRDA